MSLSRLYHFDWTQDKNKRNQKDKQLFEPHKGTKKNKKQKTTTLKHESDSDISCGSMERSRKGLEERLEELEIRERIKTI